jgi:hypothetical protein
MIPRSVVVFVIFFSPGKLSVDCLIVSKVPEARSLNPAELTATKALLRWFPLQAVCHSSINSRN